MPDDIPAGYYFRDDLDGGRLARKEGTVNNRQCPFDGCTKLVDPSYFACRAHWFSLKKPLKDRIYSCYRAWQSGEITGEELRAEQQAVLDEHYERA